MLVALCLVLWLCVVQSLYYPFLSDSPELEWWQLGPMAGVGFVLGIPVHWLWESYFKDGSYGEQSFWLLSGIYSLGCLPPMQPFLEEGHGTASSAW